ncbi:MAG: hypothetical protein M1837_000088 [Sclerophora amabilis]|nr:MAG: hypothetical protein M1837_000088 [Sclerophora amabilis]
MAYNEMKSLDEYEQAARDYLDSKEPGLYELKYRDAFKLRTLAEETNLEKYWILADEAEIHRLDDMHHTFTLVKGGKLHLASLPPDTERILDVACGTGIWAIQMAKEFPNAEIVGIDISPLQIQERLPPNVKVIKQDIEHDSWPFPEDYFDHVNISHVHGCIKDWPGLLRRARKHLKPYGTLEVAEMDWSIVRSENGGASPAQSLWDKNMLAAGKIRGRPFALGPHLMRFFSQAGLVFNHETVLKVPQKPYSTDEQEKQIGAEWMLNGLAGYDAWTTKLFTQVLGWKLADVHKFVEEVKNELRDGSTHTYFHLHVVTGSKRGPLHITDNSNDKLSTTNRITRAFIPKDRILSMFAFGNLMLAFLLGILGALVVTVFKR